MLTESGMETTDGRLASEAIDLTETAGGSESSDGSETREGRGVDVYDTTLPIGQTLL